MFQTALRLSIIFVLAHVLATGQIHGEKHWEQVCERLIAIPLAVPAFAQAQPEETLQRCDSVALYYGFDRPADWPAAVQCAYYQRSHPGPREGDPFYGPGVLTMLYANGLGVARNYDLAIRFTCENTWAAQAEIEARINHLEQLRATSASVTKFDLCDDATSGLMGGACEFIQQQFLRVKRRHELDSISAAWSHRIKDLFKSLDAAEEAFATARVRNEIDLSGSARAAFSLEEEGRLRDQFLINLKRFAKADVPRSSLSEYQKIDHRLNRTYQRIEQSPAASWEGSTIKPLGIRETEKAWLKLRDAWVEFACVAYPRLSADAVRAQITRLRLHQLETFKHDNS